MMGHRTEWLALAGKSRVSGYLRKSSSGKTVQVDAYMRSVSDMTTMELEDEFKRLEGSTKPADVNRRAAVVSRLRTKANATNKYADTPDLPTGRARARQGREFRKEVLSKADESKDEWVESLRKPEPKDEWVESLRKRVKGDGPKASPAAAAMAIKKAGSLKGLDDLTDRELESIVDSTRWNEPGDEWGERALEIIQARNKAKKSTPEQTGAAILKANKEALDNMRSRRGR